MVKQGDLCYNDRKASAAAVRLGVEREMYNTELLSRYPYFRQALEKDELAHILDPLTGLIARPYMLGFVKWLIEAGTPFTFGILDLDNFKFINDTYGHHVGDEVLADVARSFAATLDGIGLAGRFGGDEYLMVNLRDIAYADKKAYLNTLYLNGQVLRKNIHLPECTPFITGTIGCATYPDDAQDYDELFSRIDKTLYRGKTKGRNCYIIYVEEKHRDIEISSIARQGMFSSLHTLVRHFEMVPGLKNRLRSVTPLLMEELRLSDLYYMGRDRVLRSVRDPALAEPADDIDRLMQGDDMISTNAPENIGKRWPIFAAVMNKMEIETLMIVRVSMDDFGTDGYLLCAEPRNRRIWQEDECAIMYFLAKLIAARIRLEGETL